MTIVHEIPSDAIVIEVDSQPDSEFDATCSLDSCERVAMAQQQIMYLINYARKTFVFPKVWAAVCPNTDEHTLFDPVVGDEMMWRMFEAAYPERVAALALLESAED